MSKVETDKSGVKSMDDTISIDVQPLLTPIALLISALMISITMFVSINKLGAQLSDGVKVGTGNTANAGTDSGDAVPTGAAPAVGQKVTTKIDDDAYKGNKDNAKVAIVEFSDYECPFCKRFYSETLSQLLDEYVNSDKAIFVYRDLPLDALHPNARNAALAAECAGEEGNDKYFEFHNKVFEATEVLSVDTLKKFAGDTGLNTGDFNSCLDDKTMADEVSADEADAAAVGINGTPGFVVGTLNEDGTVEGEVISGAVPITEFQRVINQYTE